MFRRAVPNVSFHKLDAAQPATPQLMQYEGLLLAAALIVIDLDQSVDLFFTQASRSMPTENTEGVHRSEA